MANILIIGCGAIGLELAKHLLTAGHIVTGLKRNPPAQNDSNIKYVQADITSDLSLKTLATDFDCIFFIVSADSRNDQSYHDIYVTGINNVIDRFAQAGVNPPWFFVSSTSVYGQTHGEWVNEDTPTLTSKGTSLKILAAEQRLMALNAKNIIIRFSGIYGPGREYLLKMARQSPIIQRTPSYYTNRVHQHDCVAVLAFLFEQRIAGKDLSQCYLVSDDDPGPLWDVMTWITAELGYPAPTPKIIDSNIDMNKRCSNDKVKQLGFTFTYPSYRHGYSELLISKRSSML